MPHMNGDTNVIIMVYGVSDKPPFIARGIVFVHHQHLKAEAAPWAPSRNVRG